MRRSSGMRAVAVAVAAVSALVVGACSSVPQAVIQVPSTYTFGTAPDRPSPGGTVLVCYSGGSNLYIRVSVLAVGNLQWTPYGGTTRTAWGLSDTSETQDGFTQTAVLEPGCGTLSVSAYFEHGPYTGPPTITVEITDVPPPGWVCQLPWCE